MRVKIDKNCSGHQFNLFIISQDIGVQNNYFMPVAFEKMIILLSLNATSGAHSSQLLRLTNHS